jgi:hypothetical protein
MAKYFTYGLVVVVLAILPSLNVISTLEVYDEKRFFQLLLLLFAAVIMIIVRRGKELIDCHGQTKVAYNLFDKSMCRVIILILSTGLLLTWFNGDWYYSLREICLYLLLFIFSQYIAYFYKENSEKFMTAIWILLISFGCLYALKFFIGFGLHLYGDYPIWPGWSYKSALFGWSHPRFFNQIQVWTLPLFIVGAIRFKADHPIFSKVFLFLAGFWWCLLLGAGGRGATLCLVIAGAILLIALGKKGKQWLKTYSFTFAVGTAAFFLIFYVLGSTPAYMLRTTSSGRLEIWQNVLSGITANLFLGNGIYQFSALENNFEWAHPHNSVLQIAYEFGVPVLIILALVVCLGLYLFISQNLSDDISSGELNIRAGLTVSLLAGCGYSLVSGVIVMPLSQIWMALVVGWAMGMYRLHTKQNLETTSKAKIIFGKFCVAATVFFLSYSIIADVPELKRNQELYNQKHDNIYNPRFWQQGKIGLDE